MFDKFLVSTIVFLLIITGVVIGGLIMGHTKDLDWQKEAVKHGAAYYKVDKNGRAVWSWKEEIENQFK